MIPEQFVSQDTFRYRPVSQSSLVECTGLFEENLEIFKGIMKTIFGEYTSDLRINYPMIYRIIERVDQRRDYYLYFHSNHKHAMEMSQAKEIALFCYWAIKYKPISFESSYDDCEFFLNNGYTINEYYAAFLLMSFVTGLDEDNVKYYSESAISTLTYSLANREISKEALILYVESFLTQDLQLEENNA